MNCFFKFKHTNKDQDKMSNEKIEIAKNEGQGTKTNASDVIHIDNTEEKERYKEPSIKQDNMINNIIQIDNNEQNDTLDTSIESDSLDVSQVDVDNKVPMDVDNKVNIDDNKIGLVHISVELQNVIDKMNISEEPLLDTINDLPEMGNKALF